MAIFDTEVVDVEGDSYTYAIVAGNEPRPWTQASPLFRINLNQGFLRPAVNFNYEYLWRIDETEFHIELHITDDNHLNLWPGPQTAVIPLQLYLVDVNGKPSFTLCDPCASTPHTLALATPWSDPPRLMQNPVIPFPETQEPSLLVPLFYIYFQDDDGDGITVALNPEGDFAHLFELHQLNGSIGIKSTFPSEEEYYTVRPQTEGMAAVYLKEANAFDYEEVGGQVLGLSVLFEDDATPKAFNEVFIPLQVADGAYTW